LSRTINLAVGRNNQDNICTNKFNQRGGLAEQSQSPWGCERHFGRTKPSRSNSTSGAPSTACRSRTPSRGSRTFGRTNPSSVGCERDFWQNKAKQIEFSESCFHPQAVHERARTGLKARRSCRSGKTEGSPELGSDQRRRVTPIQLPGLDTRRPDRRDECLGGPYPPIRMGMGRLTAIDSSGPNQPPSGCSEAKSRRSGTCCRGHARSLARTPPVLHTEVLRSPGVEQAKHGANRGAPRPAAYGWPAIGGPPVGACLILRISAAWRLGENRRSALFLPPNGRAPTRSRPC
jgi:hypothetical protein